MYVPAGVQQSVYGQTFYGNTLKNLPVGQTALFSPGAPLPTQQGVNPLGQPIQWRYPVAVNTFPPDRTLQQDDIPSFEQLRRLARLDYGINLCEQYWLDLVPRMTMNIVLRPEAVAQGAEEKNFQKEITYFKNFFYKPDGEHNWHEWIQMGLRENSQVDDVYIYKKRTRGGRLLGLSFVAADQMKPLLDDWGYTPPPPKYAYQQYPWGIPGALYTTDQMIHKRGTPAVDDPYGMSRVEKVILITNIALRKARMDLAHYTEGNIPAGFMEVPESANWTPDQIDSYEQSWNALLAGNLQQMVRVKFGQPGMKYTPFVQPAFDSVFDRYMLNIRASIYGVPMDELGFTENSNRSVGESQEAMVYRRTVDPLASVYSAIFSECMATDFEPSLHGDLLMVKFGGYEEDEDEQSKAITLSTYTNAGILGLSAAAKLANLPEDPKAPQIGRVYMSKDGPIFLDDMASDKMRNAALQAKLAGFQMAANPPDPAEDTPEDDEKTPHASKKAAKSAPDEKQTMSRVVEALAGVEEQLRLIRAANVTPEPMVSQQGSCDCETCRGRAGQPIGDQHPPYHEGCDCSAVKGSEYVERTSAHEENKERSNAHSERTTGSTARAGSRSAPESVEASRQARAKAVSQEYRRWRERAIADIKASRAQRPFESTMIPENEHRAISIGLECCENVDQVRALFDKAREWQERDTNFLAGAASASSNGGNPPSSRSAWKLRW